LDAGYRNLIFVEKAGNFIVGRNKAVTIELEIWRVWILGCRL